jgi:hypothetical protein
MGEETRGTEIQRQTNGFPSPSGGFQNRITIAIHPNATDQPANDKLFFSLHTARKQLVGGLHEQVKPQQWI